MKFFSTVIKLCTGFRHYRDIRDLPVGASIFYIFRLVALLAVLTTLAMLPWALDKLNNSVAWADSHLPKFSIRNGQVETTVPQPYRTGDKEFLFILDTTGKTTDPDPSAKIGFLVKLDQIQFWEKQSDDVPVNTRAISLRNFPEGDINHNYVRQFLHMALILGVPLLCVIGTGVALVVIGIQACLFAVVAAWLERSISRINAPLQFRQLLNIALFAATPGAILVAAYTAMRLEDFNLRLVFLIAYGITVIGASNACRVQAPPTPDSAPTNL